MQAHRGINKYQGIVGNQLVPSKQRTLLLLRTTQLIQRPHPERTRRSQQLQNNATDTVHRIQQILKYSVRQIVQALELFSLVLPDII